MSPQKSTDQNEFLEVRFKHNWYFLITCNDFSLSMVGHLGHIWLGELGTHLVTRCVANLVGPHVSIHARVIFPIQKASLIHLVFLCASLSITLDPSQSMMWFSVVAWSVTADLCVVQPTQDLTCLAARLCVVSSQSHPCKRCSSSYLGWLPGHVFKR